MIDSRKLKSVNQWFNKENAKLQRLKDKQGDKKGTTNRQKTLVDKRNRQVNDYMNKTAKMIMDYCITHDIGTLVIDCNETFRRNSDMGKKKKQNFVNILYGKLRFKLEYLCERNGMIFVKQEESYTSKASF